MEGGRGERASPTSNTLYLQTRFLIYLFLKQKESLPRLQEAQRQGGRGGAPVRFEAQLCPSTLGRLQTSGERSSTHFNDSRALQQGVWASAYITS